MPRSLSEEEIATRAAYVRDHWNGRAAVPEIAAALGLHERTVERIARQLGLPRKRPKGGVKPKDLGLSPEKIAEVEALWRGDRNLPIGAIEAQTGVCRADQMTLARRHDWPARRPAGEWRKEEDARLAQLWAEGRAIAVVSKAMGRTPRSISNRVTLLGLPKREVGWHPAHVSMQKDHAKLLAFGPATWKQLLALCDGDKSRAVALRFSLKKRGLLTTRPIGTGRAVIYTALGDDERA